MCVCFLLISVPVPLCPGLSSSPTAREFIHRKCRRALRVAGLMRSDVASPASRELSMSGRSARGKQTVDKIFNTALPVHGSNTSEKDPLQNPTEKKILISNFFTSPGWPTGWLYHNQGAQVSCHWRCDSGGNAGAESSSQDDLCIVTFISLCARILTQYPHLSVHFCFFLKKKYSFLSWLHLSLPFYFPCPASFPSPGGEKKTYGQV